METRLTCQGRSCHYLRVGRKPETLMAKFITSITLTRARVGSTPETGRSVAERVCTVIMWCNYCARRWVTFDLLQMITYPLKMVIWSYGRLIRWNWVLCCTLTCSGLFSSRWPEAHNNPPKSADCSFCSTIWLKPEFDPCTLLCMNQWTLE